METSRIYHRDCKHPMRDAPCSMPHRPAAALSTLAESIIAAVSEHYGRGNGGKPGAADQARRIMLAEFADIGISPAHLSGLARVILAQHDAPAASAEQETCPIHRQPVSRCPRTCDYGARRP